MKTNSINKIIKILKNKLDIKILQLSKIETKLKNLQNAINNDYQSIKTINEIPLNISITTYNKEYLYHKIILLKEEYQKIKIHIEKKKSEILFEKLEIEKFNIIKEGVLKEKKEKINKKNLQTIDAQFIKKLYYNE